MDRKPADPKNRTSGEPGAEPASARADIEARDRSPKELSREEQEILARENRLDGENHFAPGEGADGTEQSRSGPARTASNA